MKERRRWITTLVLVAICGALAAYVLLVEVKRELPPEEGALPTLAPLWEFEGGDVVEIAVTKGEQTTAAERADGGWRMTEPEPAETDDVRLDGLVAGLAGLTYSRALADVGDGLG